MLSFTVLGAGTSVPSARMAPAHLVRAGEATLLLDAGAGGSTSLFHAGVTLDRLTGLALTHLHPDHTAELVPILFALVNPAHPPRTTPLPIRGPRGLAAHLAAREGAYGRWIRPDCGIAVEELAGGQSFRLEHGESSLLCTGFAVTHSAGSLAYRVEADGASLCYSGDSGVCPGLVEAARAVDLFVCECSVLEGKEVEGHLTATQVGEVAAAAGCRRVVLTHLYGHQLGTDPVARVAQRFDGPVELAEEGRVLEVLAPPA
jgi:ribonuclease BN (tRNA processing enzyme)